MKKRKTATLLVTSLGGGGAELVCLNIANELSNLGWEIDLVVLQLKNFTHKKLLNKNINLINLNSTRIRKSLFPLNKYIKRAQPQRVLAFNYELTVLMVFLRTIFKYRYKLISRNINTFSVINKESKGFIWNHKRVVQWFINKFYFRSDHVLNQCNSMEKDLLKFFPQLTNKTSVIYNPVAKYVEEYAKENYLRRTPKKDFFLCIGRLEKQKAFHNAIYAFSTVLKTNPNFRLKIVGQGSLEEKLKKLSLELGIEKNIDFEGYQPNIIPYYLQARATILTSIYEGFPNVLIESITLGTPVISFDCPSGPNEIIINGTNGYLIDYLDNEQLKKALLKLINKRNVFDFDTIIETSKKFNNKKIIQKYEKLLLSF